jgi:hypothetical protein
MFESTQGKFFTLLLLVTAFMAISWLTFAQLSMRPIEKKMKADDKPDSFSWDGVGARIFSYAFAIVFPEKFALRLNRLMDVTTIRSYANKSDRWRGALFLSITYTWLILILSGAALGLFD